MKIDLLITEIHTGGAERCCTQLAIYLQRRNHDVRLISIAPPPTGPTEELLWKELQKHRIPVEFLNASKSTQLLAARGQLLRLIRHRKPDIAQTFLWHANLLGAWCYSPSKVPVVAGARVAEPRRWRNAVAWTWRNRVEKVVCVSDEIASWEAQQEGFPPEKLLVIPNGIELPELWKGAVSPSGGERPSEKILLFVGRLETQKGIDILLERAPAILQALPEHRLAIIGQGTWTNAWQQWLGQSPLAARVELLGRRSDVLDWMRRSRLLLLPTRYEGMPNVVLEAMAVGLPVATMQVEGIGQLLGDSYQEQSVAAGDWNAWERLTVQLASDQKSLERLGRENRKRVETHFQLEEQMRKYELLYSEILGRLSKERGT